MAKRLNDFVDVKVAVKHSNTSGALVGTAVNTTGYSRARFVFTFGDGSATTAALATNIGIWKAAGSATTYASVPTAVLAAVTSGVLSGSCVNMVIDMPTDASNPWLKVSGAAESTSLLHSAIVELYDGINRPPTSSAQQLVTI